MIFEVLQSKANIFFSESSQIYIVSLSRQITVHIHPQSVGVKRKNPARGKSCGGGNGSASRTLSYPLGV